MKKECLKCQKPIEGRSDKKFCCDNCRNSFNNQVNKDSTNDVRNINNALRKNRRILKGILESGKTTATMQKLTKAGFDFNHITGFNPTKENKFYKFCYEFGYLQLNSEEVLVVKRK